MLKRIGALFVIGAASVLARAQTAVLPIYACTLPGTQALVSNLKSTNYQMGVIPSCTVKVYLTGTTTIATTTPQSPFVANTNGSIPPIYAPTNGCYDVVLSGGTAPNTYPIPLTFTDVCPGGGGSGGQGIQTINNQTGPAITVACGFGLTCNTTTNTVTISLNSGFTINSFTGCGGSLELGQTVTNPTCSATYSGTPVSANITNTDSIDSPLVLITPFTSGTIVGSFHHVTITTTTVTLTAIGSSSQTANQTYSWNERIFSGLGTAGASSTVTASGTTAVLSTSDVLPSAGLGAETVGQTFGPYAPSGQAVYLLLTGSSHTFTDVCSGFPFAFNAPLTVTFVNQFGVSLTMYLYQSTNSLTGSCFEPEVAS